MWTKLACVCDFDMIYVKLVSNIVALVQLKFDFKQLNT